MIRTLPTTLLQIFCKIISQFKSYCQKYHRSRRRFLDEALSINGLTRISKPSPQNWQLQSFGALYFSGETNLLGIFGLKVILQGSTILFLWYQIITLIPMVIVRILPEHWLCKCTKAKIEVIFRMIAIFAMIALPD